MIYATKSCKLFISKQTRDILTNKLKNGAFKIICTTNSLIDWNQKNRFRNRSFHDVQNRNPNQLVNSPRPKNVFLQTFFSQSLGLLRNEHDFVVIIMFARSNKTLTKVITALFVSVNGTSKHCTKIIIVIWKAHLPL